MLRNLAVNPSFEVSAPVPDGAARTQDWAASGAWSLFVPPPPTVFGYGNGPYGAGSYGLGPSEDD